MSEIETQIETEKGVKINSYKTGLTEIHPGDKIILGSNADYGSGTFTITSVDESNNLITSKKHGRVGKINIWRLYEVEEMTVNNDTYIARDGELIA